MARILVVDDSSFARHRIQQVLEEAGHVVVGTAASGVEALDRYVELRPDLVTLDHVMDDTPGEVTLQRILKIDARAKVVMVSGSDDASLEERVMAAGARAFVEKFSRQRDLLQVVEAALMDKDR